MMSQVARLSAEQAEWCSWALATEQEVSLTRNTHVAQPVLNPRVLLYISFFGERH